MQATFLTINTFSAILKRARSLLPAAALSFILANKCLAGGAFDLRINDVSGLDEPWPLIGGLPFPEGALRDASRIRIVREDGVEVPAQIDVAATWRDGSIRWALAGFTASPQDGYRAEFGPGVSRSAPEHPLIVQEQAGGGLIIDTGAAVYEFLPDRLLPDSGRMDNKTFLSNAGDGTYLVDNQGRLARVAGARAEIATEIIKQGPLRAVIRREGWYVTGDGDRIARAKVWFYFAAGTPCLRITHSLVFTENTNDLWIRDYGLEFNTPQAPEQVAFAHRQAMQTEMMDPVTGRHAEEMPPAQRQSFAAMFTGGIERQDRLFRLAPGGQEVYMYQDVFPHFLEREFRAVIGRSSGTTGSAGTRAARFWMEPWEMIMDVAGDWGDGCYGAHGLTVVMPWMAQQFPKEIAFGPDGARATLWSGRGGRELDFRPITLINEYWQDWAAGEGPGGASMAMRVGGLDALAGMESNARGAARTHDIWLLPRRGAFDGQTAAARAKAASNPPLLQADPDWLCAAEAVWPMHPKDEARFPREEALLSHSWESLMFAHHQLRRAGFIAWGASPSIRHARSPFFRLAMASDYGLRYTAWGLYARSGERAYWEFASRFNRHLGDWELCHWTAGEEHQGRFTFRPGHAPIHWGHYHALFGHSSSPRNWLLEHYLTGDEYMLDLARMNAAAIRQHWDGETLWPHGPPSANTLITVYAMDWDEELGNKLRKVVHELIDLDVPNGFSDTGHAKFGALYKVGRDMAVLYNYYRVTGDELARQAFLKAADYKYRFNRVRGAYGGQSYDFLVFSVAWKWTGNRNYLRVVNATLDEFRDASRFPGGVQQYINPFYGVPVALAVEAEIDSDATLQPFPVLAYDQDEEIRAIRLYKPAGRAVNMGFFMRLCDTAAPDADPVLVLAPVGTQSAGNDTLRMEIEQAFHTQYEGRREPRARHVRLEIPADAPGGRYTLRWKNARKVVLLDTDAEEVEIEDKP